MTPLDVARFLEGLAQGGFSLLVEAAPAVTDTGIKGSLALSRVMYKIAQTSLAQVTVAATSNGLMKDLFLATFLAVVLNWLYEASKVFLRASHRSFTLLLNPDLVKKFIRACIFSSLALGAYGVLITNADQEYPIQWFPATFYQAAGKPFEFFRVDPAYTQAVQAGMDPVDAANALPAVQDLQTAVTTSEASGEDFGDTWAASLQSANTTPEVLLAALNMRITDATGKINAFTFVTDLQKEGMKDLGIVAANKVWKEQAGVSGTPPGEGGGPAAAGSTTESGLLSKVQSKIIMMLTTVGFPALLNTALSFAIAGAYFAMDLVIVKVLWLNAIYLVLSYKLALLALPLALLLGYFPATTSLLSGIGRHVIVCVLTFNIYGLAVAKLIDPDYIKTTISTQIQQDAQTAANASVAVPDAVLDLAKQVYIDMKNAAGGEPLSQREYIDAVRARMGAVGTSNTLPGLDRYTFYPIIGLLMLAFLVSLVGKIMTILQDSLSGTMSYHRSG